MEAGVNNDLEEAFMKEGNRLQSVLNGLKKYIAAEEGCENT